MRVEQPRSHPLDAKSYDLDLVIEIPEILQIAGGEGVSAMER